MADVGDRRTGGTSNPGAKPDSRGQLMLVTALSLAILFVTLALILNTAIFTENLATRSGDIGGGTDAVRYHDAARNGVGGVIGYVNAHNHTSESSLQSNLSNGVDAFRNHSARLFADGDRAVETTLTGTNDGSRIAQNNDSRSFTNQTGNATDWTLVEDVENARAVEINVTDNSSLQDAGSGKEFTLVLNDGSNTWRLNVTKESDSTFVGIENHTDTFKCNAISATPLIDVTAGTIDGEPCEGLRFADGLEGSYDIRFENGDNVTGTFSIVVNDTAPVENVDTDNDLVAHGDGNPFATHAVYSANVTVVYQTPRLYYEAAIRVAPEEPDDR